MRLHWGRAVVVWVGVVPVALIGTALYYVWPVAVFGYPVLPSLLLIGYIIVTSQWVFEDDQ